MKSAEKMLRRLGLLRQQVCSTSTFSATSVSLLQDDPTEVLFENVNNKGVITLNRVPAHNAINHNMTVRIHRQLRVWEKDTSVSFVIIKGAGAKAFSAGGDVRELAETAQKNHNAESAYQFLRDEYNTQYTIGTFRKPYISLIDGYCMGGGCGLAVNGRYRVATEQTVMSMPETTIGFYPDNGGSHFLSHLPGALGTYLGLTCAQVKGEDTYKIGLATHYTTSKDGSLQNLEQELLSLSEPSEDEVVNVLDRYHHKCSTADPLTFQSQLPSINRIFSLDRVEEIYQSLREDNSEWAQNALKSMLNNSPTCQKITHRMLREAKELDLYGCLVMELRLGRSILQNPSSDFFRGVKAVLVNKTGRAQWKPSHLEEITEKHVDTHFTTFSNLGLQEFTPT